MSVLRLLDYRRTVADLYAEVRALRRIEPAAAHDRWRAGRDALFARHPESPIPAERRPGRLPLPVFPYDPALAFVAKVDTDVPPEHHALPRSGGGTMAFDRVGVVDLPVGRLELYWLDAYGGGLFVPFRDATNGDGTYGGGRYLLDTVKGADLGADGRDRLVLDLNFAYHPSCYHDSAWSCPLAPPANWLDAPVPAGERVPPSSEGAVS
jgi:uncharacterized protein